MTGSIDLTPEQKEFLARACALIDTKPAQQELDKLFTLAAMLLPEAVVAVLRRRVASVDGTFENEALLGRWLR